MDLTHLTPASAAAADHAPREPQHPSDLFSSAGSHPQGQQQPPSPQSPQQWPNSYPMNNPSWGGYPAGDGSSGSWGGYSNPQQPMMGIVPPEYDPDVDSTNLDRKTANQIQQEVAKWARDTHYNVSRDEGKPLLRPIRNMFMGLIAGTFAGRLAMTRFAPSMVEGHKIKGWLMGVMFGGYPLGGVALYLSQVPSVKAVLEKRTPLGVQARYIYRVSQAEKSGMPPPPPPPFAGGPPTMQQQPGSYPPWGPAMGQQPPPLNQPPPQPLQWNTFQPHPQYPPPTPSNVQQWGGNADSSNNEARYRSWDEIRRTNGANSTDQLNNQSADSDLANSSNEP